MIFGRTHEERKPKARWTWVWIPTRLEDGRWAWWQQVYAIPYVDFTVWGRLKTVWLYYAGEPVDGAK